MNESERRLRMLAERVPALIYLADARPPFAARFVSEHVATMLGFTADEWLADPGMWLRQVHPDDRDRVIDTLARLRPDAVDLRLEYRLRARDGREIWVRDDRAVIRAADGAPLTIRGVMTDITAERRARDELVERTSHARLLADVTVALTGADPLDVALARCAEALGAILGVSAGIVALGADGQPLARASAGWPPDVDGRFVLDTLVDRLAASRHPCVVDGLDQDAVLGPWAARAGLRALAGYPLLADGRLVGAMTVVAPAPLTAAAQRAAATVADAVALGVDRKASADALARAQEEVTAALLGTTVRLPDVIHRLGGWARTAMGADVVRIRLVDPHTGDLNIYATSGTTYTPGRTHESGASTFARNLLAVGTVAMLDVTADTRFDTARFTREGIVSVLGAPLTVDGAAVGTLTCWSRTRRTWSAADVARLETLARHAAVAIRNARLFEDAEHRRRAAEKLSEVSRLISQSLDPDDVTRHVVASVQALFDPDVVALYRLDPAGGDLRLVATSGRMHGWTTIPAGIGVNGLAVARRQPVAVSDVRVDPRIRYTPALRAQLECEGGRALLAVPLVATQAVIGSLCAVFREPRRFEEEEIALLVAFADQAATALEHARLFHDVQRRRRIAESLAVVGRMISRSLDPEEIGRRVVENLARLVDGHGAALYRRDPVSGDAELIAGTGALEWLLRLPGGIGLVAQAIGTRAPATSTDIVNDPRVMLTSDARSRLAQAGTGSAIAVPLIVGTRAMGALVVTGPAGGAFDDEAVTIVRAFADQAGIALENARLYAAAMRRQREAEQFAHLVRTLTETLDVTTLGTRVIESARQIFDAHQAGLRILDPDGRLRNIATLGRGAVFFKVGHTMEVGEGVTGRALTEARPVVVADVLADSTIYASPALRAGYRMSGIRTIAAVPLRTRERVIGTLSISFEIVRPLSARDVGLLQTFGDQAALALETARLYARLAEKVEEYERLAVRATEAAQAKEEFLVSVSHEIGTPLTAIKAYVDTLAGDPGLDGRVRDEFVGVLKREVDRLTRLIGNILDASRLELGRLDVDVVATDLGDLARGVAREASSRHPVRYEGAATLPVKADPDRMKQVLLNLVDNAIRFSPPGEPVVIHGRRADGLAVVRVIDRGPGIDAGHEAEVFRKFASLPRAAEDRRSGTGLGLYLSSEIVKAHAGEIHVEPAAGGGGVFVVSLPLAESA